MEDMATEIAETVTGTDMTTGETMTAAEAMTIVVKTMTNRDRCHDLGSKEAP